MNSDTDFRQVTYDATDGFIRVATCAPSVALGNCELNASRIVEEVSRASQDKTALIVFPELCLCGATIGDLLVDSTLLVSAEQGLISILERTKNIACVFVVGLPVCYNQILYNCAAVCAEGKLLGLTAKQYTTNIIGNQHIFSSVPDDFLVKIEFANQSTMLGSKLVYRMPFNTCTMAVDLNDQILSMSNASWYVLSGASIIVQPAAIPTSITSFEKTKQSICANSFQNKCVYLFSNASKGESSTDYVFADEAYTIELGHILAEHHALDSVECRHVDIDVNQIQQSRLHDNSWSLYVNQIKQRSQKDVYTVCPTYHLTYDFTYEHLHRYINKRPFLLDVDNEEDIGQQHAFDKRIFDMQAYALANRLDKIGANHVVIGVSGGLDSTLALLSSVHAFELLKLPIENILAVSMPGFGTTERTRKNALKLAKELGCTRREVCINKAVLQHFDDINHNLKCTDVVYENSQARERTQILMDIANQCGGIVVGTGDMSELALGWATYNGDQMSMYAINSNIPKTLVSELVGVMGSTYGNQVANICQDIIQTPVSPELIPANNDKITQITEDLIGPYELHDFFMYYVLTYRFSPLKIFKLACSAFEDTYTQHVIWYWLRVFYRRFFSQQFKRSCMPDGPQVFDISLSPRGGWKMPSDMQVTTWLNQIDSFEPAI